MSRDQKKYLKNGILYTDTLVIDMKSIPRFTKYSYEAKKCWHHRIDYYVHAYGSNSFYFENKEERDELFEQMKQHKIRERHVEIERSEFNDDYREQSQGASQDSQRLIERYG